MRPGRPSVPTEAAIAVFFPGYIPPAERTCTFHGCWLDGPNGTCATCALETCEHEYEEVWTRSVAARTLRYAYCVHCDAERVSG